MSPITFREAGKAADTATTVAVPMRLEVVEVARRDGVELTIHLPRPWWVGEDDDPVLSRAPDLSLVVDTHSRGRAFYGPGQVGAALHQVSVHLLR